MTRSTSRLGVLMFVLSESMFFLMLIIAYLVYQGAPASHGEAARLLDVTRTGVFSAFLFFSSYTVHRAGVAARRGSRAGVNGWLVGTIVLGAAFLAGQAWEYVGLFHKGQSLGRDLFGSTFFTLTGFHGFHVLVGLVVLSTILGLSLRDRIAGRRAHALETASVYWHFVDAVWVVIFSVVYLGAVL
ncbi:MAG: cytochrome c oxidase subunit 3 [Gemmatimonadota bacterium]|jgi:heme/copper-type cytochrome/quinol oxidase subunit 3